MKANGQTVSGVHLWLILWKTTRAIQVRAEGSITSAGMCGSDFGILEALLHKGPLCIRSLGEKVLLTSGSITTAVDRVEKRGWVKRSGDIHDRRTRIVTLTEEGREVIQRAFAQHEQDMEDAAIELTKSERVALAGLLRKFGKAAVSQGRTLDGEIEKKEEV